MFQRFTDRARKVMALANQNAINFGHEYLGTEHILLGLVKEGSGVGANVLKNLGVDLHNVKTEIEKLVKTGPARESQQKLPHTPRAKTVIEHAVVESRRLNHNYVGSEHLLLGLLYERDGIASQVLMNLGVDLQTAREEVINLIGEGQPPAEQSLTRDGPVESSLEGVDLETLINAILTGFDKQWADLSRQKENCLHVADYEKAAEIRDEAIALGQFKKLVLKTILDTPVDAASVAGQPWGKHYARMLSQLTVALIETSPDLAAQLGDTLERLRKAADS